MTIVPLLLACACVVPDDAAAGRTLRFPADRTIGELSVAPVPAAGEPDPPEVRFSSWQPLGPARGAVAVPAGMRVKLTIGHGTPADLAALTDLPPDGLHALGFSGGTFADADLRSLSHLSGLSSLRLDGVTVTDAAAPHLAPLTGLRSLSLFRRDVGDEVARVAGALPKLEVLNAHQTKIGDAGAAGLARSGSLRELHLAGTPITDAGLASLATMTQLRELSLGAWFAPGAAVTDAGMSRLAGLKNLARLDLSGTAVTDAGLKPLAALPALRSLSLGDTAVTEAGLANLAGLDTLRTLRLPVFLELTDAGAIALSRLKSLRAILQTVRPTERGLAALATMPALERLELVGAGVTDAGLGHVGRMPALEKLRITDAPITDAGLAALAGVETLESLRVWRTRVGGAGFAPLAKLPRLRFLDVDFGHRDHGLSGDRPSLAGIGHVTTLRGLSVAGWGLNPNDFGELVGLSALTSLTVTNWSAAAAPPFTDLSARHVSGLRSLEELDVSHGNVSDAGVAFLAKLTNLEWLEIRGPITPDGLAKLIALPRMEYLRVESPYLPVGDRLGHAEADRDLSVGAWPYRVEPARPLFGPETNRPAPVDRAADR